jgi:hypothetical protein
VYLEPGRDYRLIMRFEDYADDTAAYMYHCHLLLHEDEGLMGQFVVVDDGASVTRSHESSEAGPGHRPGGAPARLTRLGFFRFAAPGTA